jgi:hypothetical protein
MKSIQKIPIIALISLALALVILAQPVLAEGPLVGQIAVNTVPAGASIYLDDELLTKKSNGFILDIRPGIHTIHLSLPGYRDYETVIDVTPDQITRVDHEFREAIQSVHVSSKPSGANIYINGIPYGKTDTKVELKEGVSYSLLMTLEGYYDYSTSFVVEEGLMQGMYHEFRALPENGSIIVESIPEDAEIYLNGSYIGKTDYRIREVPPGTYMIRICKFGFDDYEASLPVNVIDPAVVSITLKPKDGVISVDSSPVYGKVFIDGAEVGTAPYAGEFAQGTHTIEVKSAGFEDFSQTVTLGLQGEAINAVLTPLANEAIAKAEAAIAANEKYQPDNARNLLSTAKTQLETGEYEQAYITALDAEKLANDVDEDYLPNYIDLQPNVKNDVIYAVPFLIAFMLVGVIAYDRRKLRVHPELQVSISEIMQGEEPCADVFLKVDNEYLSMVCTIYVDNKVIDNLATPGRHTVKLGQLDRGDHLLVAKFSVQKKRYGTITTTEQLDFEVPNQSSGENFTFDLSQEE